MDKQLRDDTLQCHHNIRFGNRLVNLTKQTACGGSALANMRDAVSRCKDIPNKSNAVHEKQTPQ